MGEGPASSFLPTVTRAAAETPPAGRPRLGVLFSLASPLSTSPLFLRLRRGTNRAQRSHNAVCQELEPRPTKL
jgi:hypothetical protein